MPVMLVQAVYCYKKDDNGVDHPVCYYSKKFSKHQRNYCTIEKERLSLILALQHIQVYLASSVAHIVISMITVH